MNQFINGINWYGSLGRFGSLPPERLAAEFLFIAGGFVVALTITLIIIGVCS